MDEQQEMDKDTAEGKAARMLATGYDSREWTWVQLTPMTGETQVAR
jgi:hypothetical protein